MYEWAFAFVLFEYAFLIAHFGVFSLVALPNMYILKLMKTVSCKALFYVFVIIFVLFCLNVGGKNVSYEPPIVVQNSGVRYVRLLRWLSCYWLHTGMGQCLWFCKGIGRRGVLVVSIVVLLLLLG